MEFEPDEIDLEEFDKFVKAVKASNPPYAKIGILGAKGARRGGGPTNAEIGAAHEYGAPEKGLPVRSFLRMPLTDQLPKELDSSDIFGDDELSEVVKTGSLLPWLKRVAVLAEGIVKKSFTNNGWGRWAPWKNGYTSATGQILKDTTQLEGSITHEVVDNGS